MATASRRACVCLRNVRHALRVQRDSNLRPQSLFRRHPPRFLHDRKQTQMSHSQSQPQLFPPSQLFFNWQEQFRDLNVRPPAQQISPEDGRRLLKFIHLEALKNRLERIHNDCISYEELLRVCMESEGSSKEEARGMAKLLDESGHLLILNKTVYLRPDKIARAFEKAVPVSVAPKSNPCREELEKLEKEKAEIDRKAKSHAMTELRLGLGFFGLQTAGLIRLTFELSWDVMEPVCFFLTSIYFMAGYLFFLHTTTDPSFKSFFNTRFSARQRKLMKTRNFDIERLRELRGLSGPGLKSSDCCRGVCKR